MADPNVELLAQVAESLGDLRERFVFVGGCATSLLLTDPAAPPVRIVLNRLKKIAAIERKT